MLLRFLAGGRHITATVARLLVRQPEEPPLQRIRPRAPAQLGDGSLHGGGEERLGVARLERVAELEQALAMSLEDLLERPLLSRAGEPGDLTVRKLVERGHTALCPH